MGAIQYQEDGITPACAGSTLPFPKKEEKIWDHPRLRGEHITQYLEPKYGKGSPPPARGAPLPFYSYCLWPRITPACAGSTTSSIRTGIFSRDHPRLRGEHGILPR